MPSVLDGVRAYGRLGLASRGETRLTVSDIHHALDRGILFLNWCGTPGPLSQAIAELGPRRKDFMVCVQFEARGSADAEDELASILRELRTNYVDAITFYYVEAEEEWQEIIAPGGALEYCRQAKEAGQIRLIGLTSHQRKLSASWAQTGLLNLLMIRYNAAHRGAEQDVFPIAMAWQLPVIAYTCLRWGGLLKPTPEDPPGFIVPRAPAWYRFVLQEAGVTVALMAPDTRAELDEDLTLLEPHGPLTAEEYRALAEHGQRVRRHGGSFS